MSELAQEYRSLESAIATDYDIIYDLYRGDSGLVSPIDRADCVGSVIQTPQDVALCVGVNQALSHFLGGDNDAWKTGYRAFFFAHSVAETAGEYDFEIIFPDFSSGVWSPEAARYTIRRYLATAPATSGLIEDFMHEIDLIGCGRSASVGRLVAGLTFMMAEDGMRESYLTAQAAAVEYFFVDEDAV